MNKHLLPRHQKQRAATPGVTGAASKINAQISSTAARTDATLTISQRAAAKLYAGKIITAAKLLLIEDYDIRLDEVPAAWGGRIKSLADLKERIKYETDVDGCDWLVINLCYAYKIESSRIDAVPKLFWWIVHLFEKTWMTREALAVLVVRVREQNGIAWGAKS